MEIPISQPSSLFLWSGQKKILILLSFFQLHVRDIANVLLLNPRKLHGKSSADEEATILKRVQSLRPKPDPMLPDVPENLTPNQVCT